MVRIQVICGGCGIEYRDEHGNLRHMLKTSEDGPFDCEEEAAARLVSLGVAVYAGREWVPAQEGVAAGWLPAVPQTIPELEEEGEKLAELPGYGQEEEEILQAGMMEEGQLRSMKVRDLENLARGLGLDTGKCTKKEDYVNLILAEAGEEDDEDEEPPSLKAEAPV